MGFQDDLTYGELVEREFIDLLFKELEVKSFKVAGYHAAYDIVADDGTKYEIKADRKALLTGNVFVEVECNEHPSGLFITEADYMVYKIGNRWFFFKPSSLQSCITESSPKFWKGTPVDCEVAGFIVDIVDFEEFADAIFTEEEDKPNGSNEQEVR